MAVLPDGVPEGDVLADGDADPDEVGVPPAGAPVLPAPDVPSVAVPAGLGDLLAAGPAGAGLEGAEDAVPAVADPLGVPEPVVVDGETVAVGAGAGAASPFSARTMSMICCS